MIEGKKLNNSPYSACELKESECMNQKMSNGTFLGIIGDQFEFGKENYTLSSTEQSRCQRRRTSQRKRKNSNRYAVCEFGCKQIRPLIYNKLESAVRHNRRSILALCSRTKTSDVKNESKAKVDECPRKERILNPNSKSDRQKLLRLKRNLEALQNQQKMT